MLHLSHVLKVWHCLICFCNCITLGNNMRQCEHCTIRCGFATIYRVMESNLFSFSFHKLVFVLIAHRTLRVCSRKYNTAVHLF